MANLIEFCSKSCIYILYEHKQLIFPKLSIRYGARSKLDVYDGFPFEMVHLFLLKYTYFWRVKRGLLKSIIFLLYIYLLITCHNLVCMYIVVFVKLILLTYLLTSPCKTICFHILLVKPRDIFTACYLRSHQHRLSKIIL